MYTDEDTLELDDSYEESEEEEPQPKRARYRQVVLRSPDDLPEEMRRGDGSQPQELESDAGQLEGMERVEDSPAAAVVATSGNHCPAVGCSYEGDSEAQIAHWRGSHLPELPLWLCPVGRCSHKCRSREALLSHLSGKRHKYSASTSERLMELPPLVETVINNRFQAPGNVVPLAGPEEIPAAALPFQHKADLGPRVSEIFKTKNVGKILLTTPSAEAFQIGDWVGFLGLPPPPPPPLPHNIWTYPPNLWMWLPFHCRHCRRRRRKTSWPSQTMGHRQRGTRVGRQHHLQVLRTSRLQHHLQVLERIHRQHHLQVLRTLRHRHHLQVLTRVHRQHHLQVPRMLRHRHHLQVLVRVRRQHHLQVPRMLRHRHHLQIPRTSHHRHHLQVLMPQPIHHLQNVMTCRQSW